MQKTRVASGIHLLVTIGVFFWVEVLVAQVAQAGDLQGADDPALQVAIETWLEDNDEDSLPAFAALAADGNVAARLLLSRIEVTDQGPSNYVNSLSRKDGTSVQSGYNQKYARNQNSDGYLCRPGSGPDGRIRCQWAAGSDIHCARLTR